MKHVTIYICKTQKSPRKTSGKGMYILEFIRSTGPETREGIVKLESMSAMQAEMITALNALRRLTEPCQLTIYQSGWLQRAFEEEWVLKWVRNGWTAASGKQVCYQEEWLELAKLMHSHIYEFRIGHHSFSNYMENELKKEMEKDV